MSAVELAPAARAFDLMAPDFDARFGAWLSVAAQRRAVRSALLDAFPVGARLLEIGGGTGEDALWLAEHGRNVVLTDASPAMAAVAEAKFAGREGLEAHAVAAERLETWAAEREQLVAARFDGAYSNFAGLNCVADLQPVARGLARLVRPAAPVLLVVFGVLCPGEMLVESLRGRPSNMLRRLRRGLVPARLRGQDFEVRYHRAAEIDRALSPWFAPAGRQAIGLFVPPSAAEPWISAHPRLVQACEALDRRLARPLAALGDHVLYRFVRTEAEIPW